MGDRAARTPTTPELGYRLEPGAGAHSYAGKRVRHEVRDGAAVVMFSLLASVGVVAVMTLLTRTG